MVNKEEVLVVILAREKDVSIASTLYKLKMGIEEDLNVSTELIVIDNGSADDTAKIATMAGAKVVRYNKRKERSKIVEKAIDIGMQKGRRISVMLDLMGGNQAEDAVSLVREALKQGDKFAIGYVVPNRGEDTIGCLALDKKNLEIMQSKGGKVTDYILDMVESQRMRKVVSDENVDIISKRKKRKNVSDRPLIKRILNYSSRKPLRFYGAFGVIFLLFGILSGFYTIDYFYKHQNLYYPAAFATVTLVLISGFFLVAAIMLSALNVLLERVEGSKKWKRAENGEVE